MSDPATENKPTDENLPDITGLGNSVLDDDKKAASRVNKPVRRAAGPAVRRSPTDGPPAPKSPPPPDKAKTIALIVCALLVVGILGVGGYLAFRSKPVPVVKAPLDNLNGDARALAEKALKAEALYNEGKEKAHGKTLDELRDSDNKLTAANQLFNEIVDSNQTVEGFKEKIEFARDTKLKIDKELGLVRGKIFAMEGEERRAKSKSTPGEKAPEATTPASGTPAPAASGEAEPTAADLTDANLEKLFKDNPSEYERFAKIRKAKDPTYVIKKDY